MDRWVIGQIDERLDGHKMDKEMDEWMDDGRMRGWMDGRMNNHHDLIYRLSNRSMSDCSCSLFTG